MIGREINLAAEPFRDRRPLQRAVVLLWVVAVVLVAVNLTLYFRLYTGTSQARRMQAEMRAEAAEERRRIDRLTTVLSSFDRTAHNEDASFVNRQIEARTFSWSDLFDDLAETLPSEVRLVSLAPRFWAGAKRRGSATDQSTGEVPIDVRAVARDGAVMLELIDRMFAHPEFLQPDLNRESRANDGLYDFDLKVVYRPIDDPEPEAVPEPAEGGETPVAGAVEGADPSAAAAVDTGQADAEAQPKRPRGQRRGGKAGERRAKAQQKDGG